MTETKNPTQPTLDFTTGAVTSRDGTLIGYRQVGHGPGLVVLHGSMQWAGSHMRLAAALADAFTVYLPDRRGRGTSGPAGDAYGMAREVEDVQALIEATGARHLFGVSSSGLIALQAALTVPGIDRVAVYEPALLLEGHDPSLVGWLPRFDREIAEGRTSAALITSMLGLQLGPAMFNRMPRWLLEGFTSMAMKGEDRKAEPDDVTMRQLAPTLHCEGSLIAEMAGTLATFTAMPVPVLVMGGSKGLAFLKPALDALEQTMPDVRRVEYAGLDHGAAADPSKANPKGQPERIAEDLRRFFAGQ
jgi:pimeloyl-ACP methyl ester carboxylesterase